MTNQDTRSVPLELPPNVRRAPLEIVRAFHFDQNANWLESRWPAFWMRKLRQIFDEKCLDRAENVPLRGELLRTLNVANQVRIKTIKITNLYSSLHYDAIISTLP